MLFAPGLIYINGSQKHYRNRSRVFIVCMLLPLPFSLSLCELNLLLQKSSLSTCCWCFEAHQCFPTVFLSYKPLKIKQCTLVTHCQLLHIVCLWFATKSKTKTKTKTNCFPPLLSWPMNCLTTLYIYLVTSRWGRDTQFMNQCFCSLLVC